MEGAGRQLTDEEKNREKRNLEVRILIAFNVVVNVVLDIVDLVDTQVVIVQ